MRVHFIRFRITPELLTVNENPNVSLWDVENGYASKDSKAEVFPYRVFGTSLRDSLGVRVHLELDGSNRICSRFPPGLRLAIHPPHEFPTTNSFIQISPQQDTYIQFRPKVMTTSDGLRSYAPHHRGCYFSSERQLRFFRSYSQRKCQSECLASFIHRSCHCVLYYLPSKSRNDIEMTIIITCIR